MSYPNPFSPAYCTIYNLYDISTHFPIKFIGQRKKLFNYKTYAYNF